MIVDSHCHLDLLDLEPYQGNLTKVLDEAKSLHVSHCLCISVDRNSTAALRKIADKHDNVWITAGIHPNEELEEPLTVEELAEMASHNKVIALGETGLDYFRSEGDLNWQHERFEVHAHVAKERKLPLIIHTREAKEDTLEHLRKAYNKGVTGVLHCFTEDWVMAKKAIDLGFYISFSGIVTFKSAASIQDVARRINKEHMLIETDSPWLAPVPHRGKQNYPGNTHHVAQYVAKLRGCTFEEVALATTKNFETLFNVKVNV